MYNYDRAPLPFHEKTDDIGVSCLDSLQASLEYSVGLESSYQTINQAKTYTNVLIECSAGSFLAPIMFMHSFNGPCQDYIDMDPDEILNICGKKKGWNFFKKGVGLPSALELSKHINQVSDFLSKVRWEKLSKESVKLISVLRSSFAETDSNVENVFRKLNNIATAEHAKEGSQLLLTLWSLSLLRISTILQTGNKELTDKMLDGLTDFLINCNVTILKLNQFTPVYSSVRLYDLYLGETKPYFKVNNDRNLREVVEILFADRNITVLEDCTNSAMGTKPFKEASEAAIPVFTKYHVPWVDKTDEDTSNSFRFFLTRLMTIVDSLMVIGATYEIFNER